MIIEKNNPHRLRQDQTKKREAAIMNVIEKPALTRFFYLVYALEKEKKAYGKQLADEYYHHFKDEARTGSAPNPKLVFIYLKELLEAGIVKKGGKDGKLQHYEIDWYGVCDILVYVEQFQITWGWDYVLENLTKYTTAKNDKNRSDNLLYDQVYDFLRDNLILPYVDARWNQYLEMESVRTQHHRKWNAQKTSMTRFFRMDFAEDNATLSQEFRVFKTIIDTLWDKEREDIKKYLAKKSHQKELLYWIYSSKANIEDGWYENDFLYEPTGKPAKALLKKMEVDVTWIEKLEESPNQTRKKS